MTEYERRQKVCELSALHEKYGITCENCKHYHATEIVKNDNGEYVFSTGKCEHRLGAPVVSMGFCFAFK